MSQSKSQVRLMNGGCWLWDSLTLDLNEKC